MQVCHLRLIEATKLEEKGGMTGEGQGGAPAALYEVGKTSFHFSPDISTVTGDLAGQRYHINIF